MVPFPLCLYPLKKNTPKSLIKPVKLLNLCIEKLTMCCYLEINFLQHEDAYHVDMGNILK